MAKSSLIMFCACPCYAIPGERIFFGWLCYGVGLLIRFLVSSLRTFSLPEAYFFLSSTTGPGSEPIY